MRPFRILFGLMVGLLPFRAQAFPGSDPSRERAIFTPARPEVSAISRGTWGANATGLGLDAAATGDLEYWLPAGEVGNGFVRFRIRCGGRPDITLLFRATASGKDDLDLDAYGVSIEEDRLAVYRWHQGGVEEMGTSARVPNLWKHGSLEAVAFLMGPWISVHVYDGSSLEELGALSFSDPALSTGRVGLRAHPRTDAATRLTGLWVSAATPPAPNQPDLYFGPDRLVSILAVKSGLLPSDLATRVARIEGEKAWLALDAIELERVRRAGLEPLDVLDRVPAWAADPRYAARMDLPPTPTATGFRLDESYKDVKMVEALLRGWAERYPNLARVEIIGHSPQGRPLVAIRITDHPDQDEDEPAVLLDGGIHGAELLSIDQTLDAIRILLEQYATNAAVRRIVDTFDTWCVPLVNPDANWTYLRVDRQQQRKNGRDTNGDGRWFAYEGVDLNRNFPFRWGSLGEKGSSSWPLSPYYRGPSPASEPEVQAMMDLADKQRFLASISFHTSSTVVLSPYTIDGADNPAPDVAWLVAEPLVQGLPIQPNKRRFKLQRKIYSVDGVDQDSFYHEFGTLAYLLEGSSHNPTDPDLAMRSIEGARPFYWNLMERIMVGPTLSGHVRDGSGRPVEAIVSIDGIEMHEEESWTSRPRDGRFDRLLPEAGTWIVRARTADGRMGHTTVTLGDEWKDVDIVVR